VSHGKEDPFLSFFIQFSNAGQGQFLPDLDVPGNFVRADQFFLCKGGDAGF
jgi:hypothetical protein